VARRHVERRSRGGCESERRLAVDERTRRASVYVPRCRSDGSYTAEQCHNATGYCWCVSVDGRPLPGSSTRGPQHNCADFFTAAGTSYLLEHSISGKKSFDSIRQSDKFAACTVIFKW